MASCDDPVDDPALHEIFDDPVDDPALHEIFSRGGRPALLAELKVREYNLIARQTLATAIGRKQRGAASEKPAIIRQQPDKECMCIVAEAGLCNKLRVLLSYREVAQDEGRHLIVVWPQGDFCPARFDELFEPIDGVTVLCGEASRLLEPALVRMQLPPNALGGDFHTHAAIAATNREVSMLSHLRPLPAIAAAIESAIQRCGPSFVAIHVRRTDFEKLFGEKTPEAAFEHFVQQHMAEGRQVYVATDNAETQARFAALCGGRYRSLAPIRADVASLRHTSVADAVADLHVCARAAAFMGTLGSSFSDTIWAMRRLAGTAAHGEHGYDRRPDFRNRPEVMHDVDLLLEPPLPEALLEAIGAPPCETDDQLPASE